MRVHLKKKKKNLLKKRVTSITIDNDLEVFLFVQISLAVEQP